MTLFGVADLSGLALFLALAVPIAADLFAMFMIYNMLQTGRAGKLKGTLLFSFCLFLFALVLNVWAALQLW